MGELSSTSDVGQLSWLIGLWIRITLWFAGDFANTCLAKKRRKQRRTLVSLACEIEQPRIVRSCPRRPFHVGNRVSTWLVPRRVFVVTDLNNRWCSLAYRQGVCAFFILSLVPCNSVQPWKKKNRDRVAQLEESYTGQEFTGTMTLGWLCIFENNSRGLSSTWRMLHVAFFSKPNFCLLFNEVLTYLELSISLPVTSLISI